MVEAKAEECGGVGVFWAEVADGVFWLGSVESETEGGGDIGVGEAVVVAYRILAYI
jgi:hypothetical protein